MELSIGQMIFLAMAGVIYGLSKTGIFGIAAVIVPLLLTMFTPSQALGLGIPMLVMADMVAVVIFRKTVGWRVVLFALPWALVGIVIAWRVLLWTGTLPDHAGDPLLRKIIAGLIIFVLLAGAAVKVFRSRFESVRALSPDFIHAPLTPLRFSLAGPVALVGGFITMIANNSAPVWVVLLMLFQLQKFYFLGTAAWIVFFLNVTKVPFGIHLGYINADTLWVNLLMLPFLVIGLIMGTKITSIISQRFFDILTQILALLGGLYLLLFH